MEHERKFDGESDRLRSPERIALLEVDRVVALAIEDLVTPRVLDIGTGTGLFAEAFADRGLTVAGIDSNPSFLEAAKRFVPNGDFKVGTADAIPYSDRVFDLAFLGHVLHEVDDPVAALIEALRISTSRVAILEWPYIEEEKGPPLSHRLEDSAIISIAKQVGFERVEHLKLAHMDLYRITIEAPSS